MRRGTLVLTMRKVRAEETWPSFDLTTHLEPRAAAERRRAVAARTAVATVGPWFGLFGFILVFFYLRD